MSTMELTREAEAARILVLNLRDVLADDETAAHDMIEAETGFLEAAESCAQRVTQLETFAKSLKTMREDLAARADRMEAQADRIRAAMAVAMETAGLSKLELASATISKRSVPPKLVVTDESEIPAAYWKRPDPTLDRSGLTKALRSGDKVAGCELSNGSETIAIKVK